MTQTVRDAEFWDERYRSAAKVWSGNPNPHLVADLASLSPGLALEVGAGEGADAIWLAEQGWTVTAADISQVALDRGIAQANAMGAPISTMITWELVDLISQPPAARAYDLVSVHFMHLPSRQREPMYEQLADAVRSGGTFFVVGHHPSDLQTTVKRPPEPDLLFTPEELTANLGAGWEVLASDSRPRSVTDAEGNEVMVHDTVVMARRL